MTANPTCFTDGCGRPALSHAKAREIGATLVAGMCPLHTLRAMVVSAHMDEDSPPHNDPAPFAEWITRARSSGTLSMPGLTVRDVTIFDLAEITGVSRRTLADIGSGNRTYIAKKTCAALMPWVAHVSTAPRSAHLKAGQVCHSPAQLTYAPLGTVMVDAGGRAWQRRGKIDRPVWCAAHRKYRYVAPAVKNGPLYPCHVVFVPARMYTHITV